MATDWKKVLFEDSDIVISGITASNIPVTTSSVIKVLSIDGSLNGGDGGAIRKISQSALNVPQGNTNFTIEGDTGTSTHDASSDILKVITSNGVYFGATLSDISDPDGSKITFTPAVDYITGSEQVNIISGNLADFNAGNLGADWDTTIKVISAAMSTNRDNISINDGRVSPSDAYSTYPDNNFNQRANLWANYHTDLGSSETPNPNANIQGRKSIYWLSASYIGGFSDGTVSLSASFSTFTGSVATNSSSIGDLFTGSIALNDFTGSDNGGATLSSNTSSLLKVSNLVSAQVTSIEEAGTVNQITFVDNPSFGDQGKKIRLGTPSTDPDITNINSDAHDLTVGATAQGTVNAKFFSAPLEFAQVNVSRINGEIQFGTSSLHSHRFEGDVFATASRLRITGSVSFTAAPTVQNTYANVLVYDSTNGRIYKQSLGAASDNDLTTSIAALVDPVSESFRQRINTITTAVSDATNDANDIDDLEDGYTNNTDSLQNQYNNEGIYFGTASSVAAFNAGTIVGQKVLPVETVQFIANETAGTTVLSSSYNASTNTVLYTFHTGSFITATGIFTGSGEIQDAVAGLNRYGKHAELILTESAEGESNHLANKNYIAALAANFGGGDANTRFLTGAGDFSNLANNGLLVNSSSSPSQGVIEFFRTPSTYKFGVTGSKMSPTGQPTFDSLTVGDSATNSGTLTVEGTLTTLNVTNLAIKDQFILINSGATQDGLAADDNDRDGGLIVGGGGGSGSLFMYDYTAKSWGFRGSGTSNYVDYNISSQNDITIAPEATIRTIIYGQGTPPAIDTVKYGDASSFTDRGIMFCDTTAGSDDVYIYA